MCYAVIMFVDTERKPDNVVEEIVSGLEFELATHTTVDSVVVLTEDGNQLARYDRKEPT